MPQQVKPGCAPQKILVLLFAFAMAGCGTLGGFPAITFPTSRQDLGKAIDSLYTDHPEYRIPAKWQALDDWKSRGYDFLDSRIFYFGSAPEEMYYVSFIGDPADSAQMNSSASIAIRAVNRGTGRWTLEADMNAAEKQRIRRRFADEIISRLEQYTHITSTQ